MDAAAASGAGVTLVQSRATGTTGARQLLCSRIILATWISRHALWHCPVRDGSRQSHHSHLRQPTFNDTVPRRCSDLRRRRLRQSRMRNAL